MGKNQNTSEGPFLRFSFDGTQDNLEVANDERKGEAPITSGRVRGCILRLFSEMAQFQESALDFLEKPFTRRDWMERSVDTYLSVRKSDLTDSASYMTIKDSISKAVLDLYTTKKEYSKLFRMLEANGWSPDRLVTRILQIIGEVSVRRECVGLAEQYGGVAAAVKEALDPDFDPIVKLFDQI